MEAASKTPPRVEILTIGNEVVTGLIQDTNGRTLAARLNQVGLWVSRIASVGDDRAAIVEEVAMALARAEVLIITGGLGSTHDDITKQVLSDYFQATLRPDEKVREMIHAFFERRGKKPNALALQQCEVPDKATVLYNEMGTAPGLLFAHHGCRVYALPGIPLEMEHLLEKYLVPQLAGPMKIRHRMLNTTGLTESALWEKAGPAEALAPEVTVASLPSHLGVRVRLSASGPDESALRASLDQAERRLRERLGSYVYSCDDETLEEVVGTLLRQRSWTLATAESCTGGLVARRITQVAGSSDYFLEGAVTYSNPAKTARLGVSPELIDTHGAVSEQTARAMAQGMRAGSGARITVAVTGIAGPGGGTAEKPVGLTFIAVCDPEGVVSERFLFPQDRVRNQERAAQAALNLLRLRLIGQ